MRRHRQLGEGKEWICIKKQNGPALPSEESAHCVSGDCDGYCAKSRTGMTAVWPGSSRLMVSSSPSNSVRSHRPLVLPRRSQLAVFSRMRSRLLSIIMRWVTPYFSASTIMFSPRFTTWVTVFATVTAGGFGGAVARDVSVKFATAMSVAMMAMKSPSDAMMPPRDPVCIAFSLTPASSASVLGALGGSGGGEALVRVGSSGSSATTTGSFFSTGGNAGGTMTTGGT